MTLETSRLLLRELAPEDVDVLFSVIGDAATMRWYLRPFTREETAEWITRNQRRYAEFGYGLWAVVLKETGEFIGDCGLCWQDVELGESRSDGRHAVAEREGGAAERCGALEKTERMLEVAYHMHRDHWGRGYAAEAARECMRYGFETAGVPKLMSLIRPENTQSRRVAEKNGLRIERQTMRVGLVHDVWQISSEQWEHFNRGGAEFSVILSQARAFFSHMLHRCRPGKADSSSAAAGSEYKPDFLRASATPR